METRGPFGCEFSAFVIIVELWQPEVTRTGTFWTIFAFFFGKTTSYDGKIFKILFWKFTWRHRLTFLYWNVVKYFGREIAEIVCYLPHKKKFRLPLKLATARIAPKICQGQPQIYGSQCSKFHPNRFTFGRVIVERVKAVLLAHRVNPWFSSNKFEANKLYLSTVYVMLRSSKWWLCSWINSSVDNKHNCYN